MLAHAGGADEGLSVALVFAAMWVGWIGWSRLRGRGFPRVSSGMAVSLLVVAGALAVASATVPRMIFGSPGAGPRPASAATIAFRSPTEGARATGGRLEVVLELRGGTVTDRASTRLEPDVGHIHVSLDGRLLTMTSSTATVVGLDDLTSGSHTLEAEFVAAAHATLERSDPADGAALSTAPSTLTLTFSEPTDPQLSRVEILDAGGATADGRLVPRVTGRELTVEPATPLPDGVYTVSWRVVSRVDGHVTAGAFAFGIGVDPATAPEPVVGAATTPPPTPLSVGSRVLLYAGIAVAVGGGVVATAAFGTSLAGRRPLLLAAGGAMVVGAVGIVLAERAAVDVPLADLLRAAAGRPFAWLLALSVVATAAAAEAAFGGGRVRLLIAAASAAALGLVRALGGHAGGGAPAAIQWMHLLAVSTWIGGLVWLLPNLRGSGAATIARRYSRLAFVAAPIVVATGIVRAAGELGGPAWFLSAFDTTYGTVLVAKVAVVALLLALGGYNRYRAIPRLRAGGTSPLRRVAGTEIALAAVVLGLTGTVTGLPPRYAQTSGQPSTPAAATAVGTDFATTIRVELAVAPGAPGANTFRVRVLDPDTGAPLTVDAVELRVAPVGRKSVEPTTLMLTPEGGGWSARSSNVSLAGVWRVTATVARGAQAVEVPLTLETLGPSQRIEQVASPGQPTIFTIHLPDALSIQGYLDPGTAGENQVHLTAFEGPDELPLRSGTFVAIGPDGEPRGLLAERFGEGHFVAPLTAEEGRWRFVLVAVARDGRVLQAAFEQELAG